MNAKKCKKLRQLARGIAWHSQAFSPEECRHIYKALKKHHANNKGH